MWRGREASCQMIGGTKPSGPSETKISLNPRGWQMVRTDRMSSSFYSECSTKALLCAVAGRCDFSAKESMALLGNVPRRVVLAPDIDRVGETGVGATEGLDHHPAVVVDAFEGRERLVEIDVSAAWRAAIVFAQVDVHEHGCDRLDCGDLGLLFDVGVVGVEHRTDVRMVG